MMPGGRLVDALRLLWEIIKSPEGGRVDEYRTIWVADCGLPGDLFDSTLGSIAEPTSAKWQVMFDLIFKLLPILEPIPKAKVLLGAAAAPTYIERFLDECLQLNQGSTDSTKTKRIVHAHTEKVQVLAAIFAQMDLIASMYNHLTNLTLEPSPYSTSP